MARIIPPEPDITLYETGFDNTVDLLDRETTGKSLSELVMRIEDPLVIALDGGWGSGKSFFLKCWVGAHLKTHGETSQTAYFDAFEHDFIDAPLASLMGVLAERVEPATKGETKTGATIAKGTVKLLKKSALPLTRMGLAVATYGATEAVGALGDALIKQTTEDLEKAAEDFWAKESGQRAAMEQFRQILTSLTQGEEAPQKLIIVIDELDRCRPDYALSLLEIIKHFFAVPNVHFVLGVNMAQLENSVHARYGAGIDARLYLQKFVGLTMRLPDQTTRNEENSGSLLYFDQQAERMGQDVALVQDVRHALKCLRNQSSISLRSAERTLSLMAIFPHGRTPFADQLGAFQIVQASLIVLKIHAPETYEELRSGDISFEVLEKALRLDVTDPEDGDRLPYLHYRAWANFLMPEKLDREGGLRGFDIQRQRGPSIGRIRSIIRNHLETFSLPAADS